MGFFSAIGSVVGSAIGAIGSVVGSVVGMPIIGTILSIAAIQFGTNLLTNVFKKFGILENEDELEEKGERALQAAELGIKRENYDDFESFERDFYNFELDEKKYKNRKKEEQRNAGLIYSTFELQEKYNVDPMDVVMLEKHKNNLGMAEMSSILKEIGEENKGKLQDYYKGKLNVEITEKINKIINKK